MDNRNGALLIGIIQILFGLIFIFIRQIELSYYLAEIQAGSLEWNYIFQALPNLFTGLLIIIGGLIIAIVGFFYYDRLDN